MMRHPIALLFIEDDDGDALLIEEMLAGAEPGFAITRAVRLSEGLALMAQRTFDVILTDLGLPDSQGLSTLEAVARHDLPIVVLTGVGDRKLGIEATRKGAQDYLVKDAITPGQVTSSLWYSMERKRMQRELRESETRFRTLFEGALDGILLADPGSRQLVEANRAICRMTGYAPEEILKLGLDDLHPEEELPREAFEEQLREEVRLTDIPVRRKDGTLFIADINSSLVSLGGRRYWMGTFRDMTGQKEMRSQLAQADRVASIGLMAAGVVRELSAPLTGVLFNLETISEDLARTIETVLRARRVMVNELGAEKGASILHHPTKGPLHELLDDLVLRVHDALDGGRQVREIVRGLRTFSKVEEEQRSTVKLDYAMECALNMAFNEIRYRARVVKEYGNVPETMASEGRLSQVFLNLIVNAAQAIDEGDVAHNEIRLHTWTDGGDVWAEVRDTGKGIPPAHLERLFEPFFTTKARGVGSGLGLSICQSIITGYGGQITVESKEGRGSRFIVRLPLRKPEPERRADEWWESVAPMGGRVLVLDDEYHVGKAIARLLGETFEVVVLTSALEGKRILERDQGFDLILCDLMMPQVTGMELYEWLDRTHPDLSRRMVFITGGAYTPHARSFLKRVPNIHLEKPFERRVFLAVVRQAIQDSQKAPGEPG